MTYPEGHYCIYDAEGNYVSSGYTCRRTITHNSLKPVWARWDDPGDYPSNAGSGPLRSRQFVEDITGSLHVTCEPPDLDDDGWRDFLADISDDMCPTVHVTEWLKFSEAIVDGRQTMVWMAQEWEEN